ncbi:acyl-CoA thioesterase [Thalassotalea aquiviva]|uniref:acyl-CoA thioesterase n=1 Tax=Thalassotalea aquiviva TaxID=3242415 RepID=UPI00352B5C4C
MFKQIITPRFSDTDALGHINNTLLPVWFEGARTPIFKLFSPDLDLTNWPLILAKMEVEFHAQLYLQHDIEIRTYISHMGNSSFTVHQQAWQQGQKCASGNAVMVHFSYQKQGSVAIPESVKTELQQHFVH